MLHVLAYITAKPGMRDALLAEFRAILPAVRAEKGCIAYGPAIDRPGFWPNQGEIGPDTFVVIETWESGEALNAHSVAPHMKAYRERTREMIAGSVLQVLSPA